MVPLPCWALLETGVRCALEEATECLMLSGPLSNPEPAAEQLFKSLVPGGMASEAILLYPQQSKARYKV